MRKLGTKVFSIIMAAVVSISMICPQVKAATIDKKEMAAKLQRKQYFPEQSKLKKAARKTQPEEWNKTEIKAYKFSNTEDAAYYLLTGGTKYYNKNYFKNPQKIKLTTVESGALFVAIAGDTGQAGSIYDSKHKLIQKTTSYVKTDVKAGETFYIELPRNSQEGTISAYMLNNHFTALTDDLSIQKGEGTETYHTFKMKERGMTAFILMNLVENGGNTSYKIQKQEKGKWRTIGSTGKVRYTSPVLDVYGLSSGNYRLVLKAGKKQLTTVLYDKEYFKKNVSFKKSSAKKLDAENMYTEGEQAARWYKHTVKSSKKQTKLYFETESNCGGFKFIIYQKGRSKAIKTVTTSVEQEDYTVKLPKKKATYYIKVSKTTKKTNGYYGISK